VPVPRGRQTEPARIRDARRGMVLLGLSDTGRKTAGRRHLHICLEAVGNPEPWEGLPGPSSSLGRGVRDRTDGRRTLLGFQSIT
jgi:hypothetical protein